MLETIVLVITGLAIGACTGGLCCLYYLKHLADIRNELRGIREALEKRRTA